MKLALGYSLDVSVEKPLNHKLRVTVRVDVEPGRVTLLTAGCLTRSNYPVLLHTMRRAHQLASGSSIQVDLTQSSHVDLEVLEYLRHIEGREDPATDAKDWDISLSAPHAFQLTLNEPTDLPVCLVHGKPAPEAGVDLSFYLEGTLDPASTVAAMSDENLAELTDALYRHLDTRKPLFGAHTWYDFAAGELHHRHAEDSEAPPQDELALG